MSITLYHHPFTRAANVVWMLEELGCDYELRFVDVKAGEHKTPDILALNPMGKLPILTDGGAVVSESAAIGVYLADRYGLGTLAPALDDPARGEYLRLAFFAPSVIEPGSMARSSGWTYRAGAAGWGEYDTMIAAMEAAIGDGPWLLGDRFTMADVIFGGTVRYMLRFGMLDPRPAFAGYAERLAARPALQRANARNAAVVAERDLSAG